ncbi:ATP-dependent nuclease [Halomonas sp. KHS3]|uniref:ATP-dependent nuclease n=1 Tax=Halomonas sp. KHS3 TaxID=866350 RepID=UPI00059AD933|nr:AAA family ATPase [Halomonas sp. KHS3]
MIITNITISNYRGISQTQSIPLNRFSSFVGKNDAGKSIVLNAIATFLNPKDNPVTITDFNNNDKEIEMVCSFAFDGLKDILQEKFKSKIKKSEGLDDFIDDVMFDSQLTVQKIAVFPKKSFDSVKIQILDYDDESFQFLYVKSDDELNKVLEDYGIKVPSQGKGRNSKLEKIKYIKEYCDSNDFRKKPRFIEDEFKISSTLPDVELFRADYGLEADTRFKTSSVSEVADYLEKESKEGNKLALVESEIAEEMKKEANSVKGYMSEYVPNLKEVEIKPSVSWKDAIKSVDVSFQFEGDSRPILMSHKGTGYRRLFMVARFRYLSEKNKGLNVIYLIEEPETFLHPSAQNDLLDAFLELSDDNQVVITTHSPVFAGATYIESVILCKKENGSQYENYKDNGRELFLNSIISELGIKPSFNMRDTHEKIVFVESHNDANFYDMICRNLIGKPLIGNDEILVLPFGGGEDIDSFLNIDYFDNSGRELFLIIDSDKHKDNFKKQITRAENFVNNKEKGKAYVIEKSCLENYYHPRAFERLYGLDENSFPRIADDDDARNVIKLYKKEFDSAKNIKEKNNFDVFHEMKIDEWEEVIESDLTQFLCEIIGNNK